MKDSKIATNREGVDKISPSISADANIAPPEDDPAAPSALVSSKRQSLSDVFTIVGLPLNESRVQNGTDVDSLLLVLH